MITITNQAEFDTVFVTNIANFPQNEIVRILPNGDGYNVNAPIVINKSNVIIQGYGKVRPKFKYVGASAGDSTGILLFNGRSSAQLENIIVEYLDLDGVDKSKSNVSGIYCNYVGLAQTTGLANGGYDSSTIGKSKPNKKGITVKDCIIQNNIGNGIYLSNSSNSTVTGNTVQNNANFGIYLYISSNNTVTGNTVQNNANFGISLYISSNNTITGNTAQNNGIDGISLNNSSNNNTIIGNTLQNNGSVGIFLYISSNNTFTGNTLQNNSGDGIYLTDSSNNTVTGNTLQNNSSYGIRLSTSSNNGNVIESNTISQVNTTAHINSLGTNTLILGNIMTGTGTGIVNSGSGSKTVDNIKV